MRLIALLVFATLSITRPGDCGSDNGSGGQATYESGRYAPTVAGVHWRGGSTREGQRCHHGWHDQQAFHFLSPWSEYPMLTVDQISN
jgi:hypothetical protein